MKKPFFSICIPTFNRAKDLKKAIAICLKQTFGDFEIVISDNASNDETEKVVEAFKDKRIRYFRNRTNIRAEPNYQKVFSYALGEYIFSQGDDDFILFEDTLDKVKQILDKKPWGFVRLNLLERTLDGQDLRKSFISTEEKFSLPAKSSASEIFDFFLKTSASHLAGLVIKNRKGLNKDFIDCRDSPWIKLLFETVKNDGGLFLPQRYMVITWARGEGKQADISEYYDVHEDNRLMFEDYTDFVFKQIPQKDLSDFKYNFYRKFILLQPAIKLYSGNRNLIKFDRKLLHLEPRFKKKPLFWLMIFLAFMIPKFVWQLVRKLQHKQKNTIKMLKDYDKITKRFSFLEKKII